MKIINRENLSEAVGQIIEGKVIIFPSETSYGLCCDATNQTAVDKIFKIKGRSGDKPLLVVVPNVETAKKYLEWNGQIDDLAKKYWPCPLTVVGRVCVNSGLAKGVISLDGNVAVRVSAFPELKKIAEESGKPIVSTSANIAGENNVYNSEEVKRIFFGRDIRPDAFFDCGDLPETPSTTIVKVVGGAVEILRQGEIIV